MGKTKMEYRLLAKQKGVWRPLARHYVDFDHLVNVQLPRMKENNPDREFKIQERMVVYTEWDDVAE